MIAVQNRPWIKFNSLHVSKFLWSQEGRMKTTAKIPTKVETEIEIKLNKIIFEGVCFILYFLLPGILCKMCVHVTDWKQKREV
jgi:hypothetical protein